MRDYAVISIFVVLDRNPFKSMRTIEEFNAWFQAELLSGGLAH